MGCSRGMTAEIHQLRDSSSTFNVEVEQGLLGAAMVHGVDKFGALRSEHFYDPLHQRIYAAISTLCQQGRAFNAAGLKGYFTTDPGMVEAGGVGYLAKLSASAPAYHLEKYAALVMELWQRRQVVYACNECLRMAVDPHADEPLQTLIDHLQHNLTVIQNDGPQSRPVRAGDAMKRFIEQTRARMEGDDRLPLTGLARLNDKVGGWRMGNQVFLAGRPGMGKTALGLWLAHAAASGNNYTVAFFSLEMTADECMTRLACEVAGNIPYEDVLNGKVNAEQIRKLDAGRAHLEQIDLYIDDQPKRSVVSIMAECRRMQRDAERAGSRLGLVVIDHLRKVADSGNYKNNPNKSEGEKAAMLKDMAKQLGTTVLTLVQLNRGVEGREDKRPSLSDLRDSGEIEEEADAVLMMYREAYYKGREKAPKEKHAYAEWLMELETIAGVAEVYVAKNRHGQTGPTKIGCDMATNRFWTVDEL